MTALRLIVCILVVLFVLLVLNFFENRSIKKLMIENRQRHGELLRELQVANEEIEELIKNTKELTPD